MPFTRIYKALHVGTCLCTSWTRLRGKGKAQTRALRLVKAGSARVHCVQALPSASQWVSCGDIK